MSEPSSRRVWGQRPGQPYNRHMRLFSYAFFDTCFIYLLESSSILLYLLVDGACYSSSILYKS